jgi:hypothetical protein
MTNGGTGTVAPIKWWCKHCTTISHGSANIPDFFVFAAPTLMVVLVSSTNTNGAL